MDKFSVITIFLSSSAISVIITAIFNIFIERNKRKFSGITDRRAEWRKEIKKIILDINNSKNIKDLKSCSDALKTEINPFGINKTIMDENQNYNIHAFKEDAYIWEVIKEIDSADSNKYFEKLKEKIRFYLAVLLKYDWEKSKKEISGSKNFISLWISIIFMYYLLFRSSFFFDTSLDYYSKLDDVNQNLIPFMIVSFLIPILSALLAQIENKKIFFCIGIISLIIYLSFILFLFPLSELNSSNISVIVFLLIAFSNCLLSFRTYYIKEIKLDNYMRLIYLLK